MNTGSWEFKTLTIAAIVNVPLFLIAVFILQTRFRPELQEDRYYSTYLGNKTNQPIIINKEDAQLDNLIHRIAELEKKLSNIDKDGDVPNNRLIDLVIGVNKHLPDIDQLSKKLAKIGLLDYTLFGGKEPPKGRNVSISKYLPKPTIRKIVKLARELNFTTYNLYDNNEENAVEDVLIGSYGDGDHIIAL
ncbi:hypothetical protein SDC9_60595 [bioreactor metagenome]|uniref:Uncharacterized protein n=1 Tax=bioreactor metagenome TaxID=1076179 RepID=A0A644XJH8_9ZZZZ